MSRSADFARRIVHAASLVGACGAAGLAGCGATGANLAEADGGGKSWWSPPAALARATRLTPPGLVADPIPSTRDDLQNPAALDLAYANLRTKGQSTETAKEDARAAYDRVLKDDPNNVGALLGLARLTEAEAGDRPGELDAAEDAYRRAADAAPGDARPLLALGGFQANRGRWGESAATYGKAAGLATDTRQSRTARHGLAVATAMGGDVEGSRPHFVASVGEASAHFNVGELYRRSGDRAAAVREFKLAAAKDPGGNPQLAQVPAMIAALEGTAAPAGVPAAPSRDAARIAAAAVRPPTNPFAGNPVGAGPIVPASTTAPAAPARTSYSAAYTAPVRRPAPANSFAPPPVAPAPVAAAPDAPPPWPFPNGG